MRIRNRNAYIVKIIYATRNEFNVVGRKIFDESRKYVESGIINILHTYAIVLHLQFCYIISNIRIYMFINGTTCRILSTYQF